MPIFNLKYSKYFLNKRTLKLSIGNVISQIIPFLLMPLLTRLYSPSEFGGLAIFVSITLILSEIVTGKYELAILLPKKEKIAVKLVEATIGFNIFTSLLLFVTVLFLKNRLLQTWNIENTIGDWILLIPVVVFFNGLYETYKDFSLRAHAYNNISKSFIERALSTSLCQIILGISKLTPNGLIVGKAFSSLVANIEVVSIYIKEKRKQLKEKINFKEYFSLYKEYKDFPLFSMPSSVLTTFSSQLILIAIPLLFTNSITGLYLLAQRILNIPISIIGNSIQQVYFKDFSAIGQNQNRLQDKTWELYKKLLIIGAIPTCIIIALAPSVFGLIFGSDWIRAGVFAQILSIWYCIIFITGPISTLLIVLRKQKHALIFQTMSIILKLLLLIICYLFKYSIEQTLIFFSLLSSLLLISYIVYIFQLIKIDFKKVSRFSFCVLIGFSAITYFLKLVSAYFFN